jgi:hypothetical protein
MSTTGTGNLITETGKKIAALCLAGSGKGSPLDAPLCYRRGNGLESTSLRDLLSMDVRELGRLWPLLGVKKFDLYQGLSACQQMNLGKNLETAACLAAHEDFQKDRPDTFNRFGALLGQVPRIHRMPEKERSQVIYTSYLHFIEKNDVNVPPHDSPREMPLHGNAVASLRAGRGRDAELSETLCDMLSGAGIQSAVAEAWTGVKRDRAGRYMTDGLRLLGFGTNHRSATAHCVDEKGSAMEIIFDPAQYLRERTRGQKRETWAFSLNREAWISYYRSYGWDGGSLNTFAEGGMVREEFR